MLTGKKSSEVLKGTHGTSLSRAKAIASTSKFEPSVDGHFGVGVYFWAYEENISFAKHLAESWWIFQNDKFNAYRTDDEPSLAILDAEISHPGDEYFDASGEFFLGLLVELAICRNIEHNKEKINQLKVVAIQEIERENNINYCIIKILVDTPPKPPKGVMPYVYAAKKSSECYVVKRNFDQLIKRVEIIN